MSSDFVCTAADIVPWFRKLTDDISLQMHFDGFVFCITLLLTLKACIVNVYVYASAPQMSMSMCTHAIAQNCVSLEEHDESGWAHKESATG